MLKKSLSALCRHFCANRNPVLSIPCGSPPLREGPQIAAYPHPCSEKLDFLQYAGKFFRGKLDFAKYFSD
jgi:hypothetical protein